MPKSLFWSGGAPIALPRCLSALEWNWCPAAFLLLFPDIVSFFFLFGIIKHERKKKKKQLKNVAKCTWWVSPYTKKNGACIHGQSNIVFRLYPRRVTTDTRKYNVISQLNPYLLADKRLSLFLIGLILRHLVLWWSLLVHVQPILVWLDMYRRQSS